MRLAIAAACLLCLPLAAAANHSNPAGNWRCVVNDPSVAIDVQFQVQPNGTLRGSGSIVYRETNKIFAVEGGGIWTSAPADDGSNFTSYRFQLYPQTHSVFSVFPLETSDPNIMYRRFNNPQTGLTTETACNRTG
jgi:hypothetical protein